MTQLSNINLRGRRVWVTRPKGQADMLIKLIEQSGAKAIHFPTIEIVAPSNPDQEKEKLENISNYYAVIFISRNAVICAYQLLPSLVEELQNTKVLAVGAGTQAELSGLGLSHVEIGPAGSGSEAVLQLPLLRPDSISGKKIMIVRGHGGRELLKETLSQSGSHVTYVEVYVRALPNIDPAQSKKIWQDERPDVIVVTSVEGLNNLLKLIHEDVMEILFNTPIVVISTRMQEQAKTLGFRITPCVAECAGDEGLMQAVVRSLEV